MISILINKDVFEPSYNDLKLIELAIMFAPTYYLEKNENKITTYQNMECRDSSAQQEVYSYKYLN